MNSINRGAALAASMTELRDWLRLDGRAMGGPAWHALNEINRAIDAFSRTAPTGRKVRIAVAADGDEWACAGYDGNDDEKMELAMDYLGTEDAAPLCYVEFTLPEPVAVPTIEAEVSNG